MISEVPQPLRRFPIFQTSDSEEFGHAILTKFGGVKVKLKEHHGFEARGNLVQAQDIALIHGASSSSVSIDYPETKIFRFLTALIGHGEAIADGKTVAINEYQSCIISPGYETKISGESQHGWLSLRVSESAIDQKLIALLGYRPKGKLEFEPSVDNRRPEVQPLRNLMTFLSAQLDSTAAALPPPVLRSLEQAVIITFLSAGRHTFSHLLLQDAPHTSLREVRLAEEYIEANWDKPLRIEDLTALTNVGSRTLFRSFVKARGQSPMAFAKMVRLKRAKEMLLSETSDTSVTAVAFRSGFGNLGHFAKEYREAFGELPSVTLARSRQGMR